MHGALHERWTHDVTKRDAVARLFDAGKDEQRPLDMRAGLAADPDLARAVARRMNTPLEVVREI